MARLRSLASSLPFSIATALLVAACATRSPGTAPTTAAQQPAAAEPITAAAPAAALPTPSETVALPPGYRPCPSNAYCRDECDNYPYVPTQCQTTSYGPVQADVVSDDSNMILCTGGTYALCFFSGPPAKTGTNSNNNALPCTLDRTNSMASCACQVYTGGTWFVDINGILNLGAWYQAVQECGPDGSLCKNLKRCGPDGKLCEHDTSLKTPSICGYIQNQDPNNPQASLMPGADLISAFSFKMKDDYSMAPQSDCTQNPTRYAGCMTAACTYTSGTPDPPPDGTIAYCQCPTVSGPFQIGQSGQGQMCSIPDSNGQSYVWSAAYNPNAGSGGN